jgi:signal peptidase II
MPLRQPADEPLDPPVEAAGATDVPPDGVAVAAAPLDVTPESASEPSPVATAAESGRRMAINWGLVLGIVAVDQLTKALVRMNLNLYESHNIIPGFLDITHVRNPGVAFGLLSQLTGPLKPIATTLLAVLALVGITYYARHVRPEERLARLGLSIILGGAIGNLIDRLRMQYVVDFVDVYYRGWHFWAFNVADASITIGALLVFFELLTSRHASHSV